MKPAEERYISLLTRNLSRLDKQPAALKEKVFAKLFEESEIAKFTPVELREYEDSLKVYRDLKNSLDTALAQGIEQGIEQGIVRVAKAMLERGMDIKMISELSGLTESEINSL